MRADTLLRCRDYKAAFAAFAELHQLSLAGGTSSVAGAAAVRTQHSLRCVHSLLA